MFICMCIHAYIYIHTNIYIYIIVYIHIFTDILKHTHTHSHTQIASSKEGAIFDPAAAFSIVPVIIYTISITVLNQIYRIIAEKLTDLENRRLARDYQIPCFFHFLV